MTDLTIIYYTSNFLDDHNPYFLENTRKQLLLSIGDFPLISVSQRPTKLGSNVCVGNIGQSHLNIYRQILAGCKVAKTKYVAMAEDDILYSFDHFHSPQIEREFEAHGDVFLYDMNKVSLFTWSKPPIFSFRSKRKVVNQLIAPRTMLIEALEERFKRVEELKTQGWLEEKIIKYFGDPGRYEDILGVTPRKAVEFYSWTPSIVFSHEHAYGYRFNQGKKKKHGDIRIVELVEWGRAEEVLKLWKK